MTAPRPLAFAIVFAAVALVGACGEVTEPPGVDSGISDLPTPDSGAPFPDLDADSNAPDASDDPLAVHDDAFDGDSIDGAWSRFQPELADLAVDGGALVMTINQYAQWFNRSQGPLLYKELTGNFMVTSRVRARRRTDASAPPIQNIHLGGVMARAPGSAEEPPSYVFIVVGHDVDDLSVETKTTVAGESSYTGPSWGSGDAELRICRLGDLFMMLKRPISGGAWTVAESYDRPDLPASLEVGMIAYAPSGDPDLSVRFEEIAFRTVWEKADCLD